MSQTKQASHKTVKIAGKNTGDSEGSCYLALFHYVQEFFDTLL